MGDGLIVQLNVFGFEDRDEADAYHDKLLGAYCAMPESEPYASLSSVVSAKDFSEGMRVSALVAQARREAMEEAARRVEGMGYIDRKHGHKNLEYSRGQNAAKREAAKVIRAMIKEAGQ